jgi:AcrR family transcriptional regulator
MNMVARQTRQERSEARRQQVLDAAIECFRRHGFHAASMQEISAAAGMSVGHIYHYFESKDAIIAAIVDQEVRQVAADFQRIGKAKDIVAAMLDHANNCFAHTIGDRNWSLSFEIAAEAARNPNVRAIVQDAQERIRLIVRDTLEKAGVAPRSRANLDALIDVLRAMFAGLPIVAIYSPKLNHDAMLRECRRVIKFLLQPEK